jgi:hypothetical protein
VQFRRYSHSQGCRTHTQSIHRQIAPSSYCVLGPRSSPLHPSHTTQCIFLRCFEQNPEIALSTRMHAKVDVCPLHTWWRSSHTDDRPPRKPSPEAAASGKRMHKHTIWLERVQYPSKEHDDTEENVYPVQLVPTAHGNKRGVHLTRVYLWGCIRGYEAYPWTHPLAPSARKAWVGGPARHGKKSFSCIIFRCFDVSVRAEMS